MTQGKSSLAVEKQARLRLVMNLSGIDDRHTSGRKGRRANWKHVFYTRLNREQTLFQPGVAGRGVNDEGFPA